MKFLRSILILGRVSNLPTVWTNVILGWLMGRQMIDVEVAWIALGVSFLYWAGMTLNDAFDAKWDAKHAPERPIPSGQISRSVTWVLGVLQMVVGVVVLLYQTNVYWEFLVALVVAILLYNIVHKRWQGSVYIMGACRVLVYLSAYSAARNEYFFQSISPLIYIISFGVMIYIAALTFVARRERSGPNEGESNAAAFLLLPAFFPVLAQWTEKSNLNQYHYVGLGVIACSVWIVWVRSKINTGKIPQGIAYAIAGLALYDGAVALLLEFNAGLICLGCFLLTLVLQKFIPAT